MGKAACVVKILGSSATSFAAVTYNENKVAEGVAKCVVMENFGSLQQYNFHAPETVTKFLQKIADKNDRVEHPQLHLVISYPGKATEDEKKELIQNARDLLKMMGYGNQPWLLWAHQDTDNDHYHLVSVRVDAKTGAWINNQFEGVKARRYLDELRGIKHDNEIDKMVKYNYTSREQFFHILHANGYHTAYDEENGSYDIYRASMSSFVSVSASDIDRYAEENLKKKKSRRNEELDRLKTIRGIIRDTRKRSLDKEVDISHTKTKRGKKHSSSSSKAGAKITSFRGSSGLDMTQFQKAQFKQFLLDIKRKAGIEILFHRSEDGKVRGYTVVDNAKGQVFNGSEVMKLNALLGGKNMDTEFVLSPELAAEVSEEYRQERNNKQAEKLQEQEVKDWAKDLTPGNIVEVISERFRSYGIEFDPDIKPRPLEDMPSGDINDIIGIAVMVTNNVVKDRAYFVKHLANEAISVAKLAEQLRYPEREKKRQANRALQRQKPSQQNQQASKSNAQIISKDESKQKDTISKPVKQVETQQAPNNGPTTGEKERTAYIFNAKNALREFMKGTKALFSDIQENDLIRGIFARTIDSDLSPYEQNNLETSAKSLVNDITDVATRVDLAVTRVIQLVGTIAMPEDVSVGGPSSDNSLPNKKRDDEWDRLKSAFDMRKPKRRSRGYHR